MKARLWRILIRSRKYEGELHNVTVNAKNIQAAINKANKTVKKLGRTFYIRAIELEAEED